MFNKNVLRNLSYGVYAVCAMDGGKPAGCIANCAVQLTYNTVALSLNHGNYTNEVIKRTGEFSISILPESIDPNIISIFGFTSGRDKNKFENIQYEMFNNVPFLKDAICYLALKTVQTVELETHTLFIAEITGGDILNEGTPMTYKYYHEVLKGNAPKAAPTYVEPDVASAKDAQTQNSSYAKRFRCKICGYIYEGDITKEGPNYKCPVCKQPVSVFEPVALA